MSPQLGYFSYSLKILQEVLLQETLLRQVQFCQLERSRGDLSGDFAYTQKQPSGSGWPKKLSIPQPAGLNAIPKVRKRQQEAIRSLKISFSNASELHLMPQSQVFNISWEFAFFVYTENHGEKGRGKTFLL